MIRVYFGLVIATANLVLGIFRHDTSLMLIGIWLLILTHFAWDIEKNRK